MKKAVAGLATLLLSCPVSSVLGADIQVTSGNSIAAALAGANVGDRILVEQGTYAESITLVEGVEIRGGYDASFSEASRNPLFFITTLQGDGSGPLVNSGSGITSATIVDGLTITGAGPPAAVIVDGGAPIFRSNRITENRTNGIAGGVWVRGGSTARFEDNSIDYNTCAGSGGGVRVEQSTVAFVSNDFRGNEALGGGGSLYVFQSAVSCSLNMFSRSKAVDAGGGGALFQDVPSGIIYGNTFDKNEAVNGGGLMIRDESSVTVEENVFTRNEAIRPFVGVGGGACVFFLCEVTMQNNRFSDCTAALHGGGLFAIDSDLDLLGVDAADDPADALFADCHATSGRGGGFHLEKITGSVMAVRVQDCTAGTFGGGMSFQDGFLAMQENLIMDCSAQNGGGVAFYSPNTGQPQSTFKNCTVYQCSASDPEGAGGIYHGSPNGANLVLMYGNLVTHCPSGYCFTCTDQNGNTSSGGQPILRCSTGFNEMSTGFGVTNGTRCASAYAIGNNREGDPFYCTVEFPALRDCSPDLAALEDGLCSAELIPGLLTKGVSQQICPCELVSVEDSSWGLIKSLYRR